MVEAAVQEPRKARAPRLLEASVAIISVLAALALWELISRTGVISQRDLPSMSDTFQALWSMMQTGDLLDRVRPDGPRLGDRPRRSRSCSRCRSGSSLGSSDFAAARLSRADRVPAPDPVGGADPAALSHARDEPEERDLPRRRSAPSGRCSCRRCTASTTSTRSRPTPPAPSGSGQLERLYRITLPSAVPYIMTGLRISSTVALILAFTAELFMGTPGLGAASSTTPRPSG